MAKVEYLDSLEEVYDLEVAKDHNFYANGILVHNCVEITQYTKALKNILDEDGRIALCTLAAQNWGIVREPKDFEKPARLVVRALDNLLDYQNYPVKAAELHTKEFRPLGVGIINFAYFLAKHDIPYDGVDQKGLSKIQEYAEAWSYYLIKASCDLAKERGPCLRYKDTKYSDGTLPIDTYKKDVDSLVDSSYNMDWSKLREDLRTYGIRNATLMALMPSEASSLVSNSTNGIEPPRAYVSVKQSKEGVFRQVVPGYKRYKNKYNLLWDQKSPEGYIKIMAVLQKFIDQSISSNTSYNPAFYPDAEIPMSEMTRHLLLAYKYGLKTLYYNNTADGATDDDVVSEGEAASEDDCSSCKI